MSSHANNQPKSHSKNQFHSQFKDQADTDILFAFKSSKSVPNVLSIAGTDPTGGAGVQADIKAISACGGYAMSVITAVVAQNTMGVQQIKLMPISLIEAQLDSVFSDVNVDAVKIGMLGDADIIRVVANKLRHYQRQYQQQQRSFAIILDPVMVAKSGDRLLADQAVTALTQEMMPLVSLVTPNLPEAADLLGQGQADDLEAMQRQADQFDVPVYLKGGHLSSQHLLDEQACDVLMIDHGHQWFVSERVNTHNTHGTGCTLSAAIATFLAKGLSMSDACQAAKDYLTNALRQADELHVGKGQGPVHHFYFLHEKK